MTLEANTERFYDKLAPKYQSISQCNFKFNNAIDTKIVQLRDGKASANMLDIGSGNGLRAKNLSELLQVKKLFLSDVSSEMIKQCRKNVPTASLIDLRSSSICEPKEIFDFITIQWNVLGHVETFEQRVALLQQCQKTLAPGGQIFLDVNNRHNTVYGRFRVLSRWCYDFILPDFRRGDTVIEKFVDGQPVRGFGHLFTRSELINLFKEAGLNLDMMFFFDYKDGSIKKYFFQGQIFCVLS